MCLPALSSAQQTCQPDGDVNQNGSVTAVDALLAFQQALSLTQLDACQLSIADVFPSPHAPDGNITASDALCIFQKALGSPSCFDILPPSNPLPMVSAGGDHTCGILDTGAVACWGLDDDGQSAPPAGIFTAISTGADHTCGILDTGAVTCWGLDDDGQSTPPAGTFTTVSAGGDHTCGILDTGAVTCWGLDDDGQSTPPAGTFTTISAGADHTCGILDTGAVECWGLDGDGQSTPPAGTFTTISAGADHTCGILDTGAVACWGLDDDGQSTPPAGTFTTVSAGADHTCGILDTGAVTCWGLDGDGQSMPPAGTFTTVSAGADHTCGILDTGAVTCWGLDGDGQSMPPAGTLTTVGAGGDHTCGILDTGAVTCWGFDGDGQSTPPAGTFTTIGAGADHTCGILDTGAVACWGRDDEGQSAPPAGTFTTISVGADHTCGILDTGAVACWGLDDAGQSTPPAGTFTTISAGGDHTCGILDTGAVACWGLDDDGQAMPPAGIFTTISAGADHTCGILGTGVVACWGLDDDGQSTPPAGTFTTISAGADHTCGILDTGAVVCWGLDDDGQSTPPAGTFTTISAGADHTCGILDTGAVACWGRDDDGQSAPPGRATTPDLVVASPSVSDSSPDAGAYFTFTLSATVRNEGDGASAAITLRYYRSTDATITTSDTAVGTDAVAGLAASGRSVQAISLTAPSTPGTYYYGVCVDAVTGESDTTNNCSASVQVTVPEPERPDLEVGTPTVDDARPETGATFTLSATVSNTGDGASAATTLRYYRSTDATITTSDTVEGTAEVGALAASGTSEQSISLTAPAPGTYYYGACVDTVTDESDTTNNCSAPVQVGVEAATYPDLEVETPTVDDATPETGASFTLSATVSNQGDGESVATTLHYYRSTDATITTSDTQVGTDEVGTLSASGTSAQSISLTAPAPGTYYYGACVDTVADESDTTDNCSAPVQVGVEAPTTPDPEVGRPKEDVEPPKYPDLEVGTPTVDDTTPATGASFTLSVTVSNAGDGASAAAALHYYRSTDATITTSDTAEGMAEVGALAASGSSDESISLTAPSTPGPYYYGACVDAVTNESDTTDNCSASVQVTVQETQPPEQGNPDLTFLGVVVGSGPSEEGYFVRFAIVIANVGDGASAASTLRYYRSTDATITASDTEVGTDAVPGLAAEGTSHHTLETLPPSSGTYYYGVCVDAVAGESDTTNNCSRGVDVVPEPDLEVGLPTVDDARPETGATFTLSATVRNAGDGQSPATTLRYYRSTDATITTSDTEVGTDDVGTLSASGSSPQSISLTAPATAATYYYGACVDEVARESDTTNNCSASVQVDVEAATYPDLKVREPTVNDENPETGATFTLSATVRNAGDGQSASTTLRYYRSTDATITTSDTEVYTDDVGVLSASGSSPQSISLTAPATAATYYYGACVDKVAGESDTTDNCSASVKVTVREPEPAQVVVTPDEVTFASLGDTAALTARVLDARGNEISGEAVSWSSVSPEVATVDAAGKVTAVANGIATVTASTSGVSGAATVTVWQRAASAAIDPGEVELTSVGETATVTLRAFDANGHEAPGGGDLISWAWRSADPNVATVSPVPVITLEAEVQAVAAGTTTVTVTTVTEDGGTLIGTATVTVRQPDLRIVGVVAGTPLDGVGPGTRIQFSASVRNYGDANSDATTLRYYRSTDATISGSDTEVGTDEVSALVPLEQVSEGIDLTAPSSTGAYYYGACVDAVTDESDTTNNCSASVKVDDETPETEASFTLSATVSNTGDGNRRRRRCAITARRTPPSRPPTRKWGRPRWACCRRRGGVQSRFR